MTAPLLWCAAVIATVAGAAMMFVALASPLDTPAEVLGDLCVFAFGVAVYAWGFGTVCSLLDRGSLAWWFIS